MRRRLVSLVTVGALAVSAGSSVRAQTGPPQVRDPMRAFSIVPPGQDGTISPGQTSGGPHFDDQLEMYASLADDADITDEDLATYFHSMQFTPGSEIEQTYEPTDGVTVYRDNLGIPHIFADTLENASFALGYVTAEDRLFEMDVFRHAARGTLTEFVGDGEDGEFLRMDIATRREGYTEEEIQTAFDNFDDRFGNLGAQIQTGLQAYADGVNLYINQLKTNPAFASRRPLEYEGTANPFPVFPEEWSPLDTLFLAVLQLRVFGETAGFELQNAGLYAHLVDKLGRKLGPKVYNDLLFQNDPRSYTSIPRNDGLFASQNLGVVKKASFAIPDDAQELARDAARRDEMRRGVLRSLGFPTGAASNALLVAADESATGNPLEIGAPQVGYAVPSFFMDVNVHVPATEETPAIDFRGPAVPGASALIPLGRGRDYAWSLTTGFSDAVDTRVELLCEPGGGEPTDESNGYMFRGKCKEMESRDETFIVKPTPTDPGPPQMEERTFYRTVHGPVFARGAVKGKPVAFVKERFFWMKELDSIPQFAKWNTQTGSLEDFADAASKFTMSFNTFYADAENIAYFHVGHYPKRARGVHPSLPTWGTGRWEWKGRVPFAQHPTVINPKQGWVANWNNKPARGWDNHDGFKWGAIQRVQLLADSMGSLLGGTGKARLTDLVDVIADAATRDVRAVYLGPKMISWARRAAGDDEKVVQALELLAKWVGAGAHRENANRDESMDDGAALALFDEWYRQVVHAVFDDELGEPGFELMEAAGAPVSDYSPTSGSSFFFDFSSYLSNLFKKKTRDSLATDYCNDRVTPARESCKQIVGSALTKAIDAVAQEQGQDMTAWETEAENLIFQALGAGSVPDIPWQNRGTHNHVVEIRSSAGR